MWLKRESSPQMVTPERRKIFRLISVLKEGGFSWTTIADELNRKGLFWRATGRPVVPFTNKSANDFYRHHQGLWPQRTRKDSQVQLDLLHRSVLTSPAPTSKVEPPAPVVPDYPPPAPTVQPVQPVKQAKPTVHREKEVYNEDSDNSNVTMFKQRYGDTAIKVVVRDLDGMIEVVVRYTGKRNANATSRVAGLVQQLQGFDYRD
jgi:hypothetical protein